MEDTNYKTGQKLYIIACCFNIFCLFGLIIYHIFDMQLAGHGSTCFVNYYWHIYCPGCGGTRAFDYLMHGNFIKSIMAHPVNLYLAVIYLSYFFRATYTYVIKKDGRRYYKFHPWTLIVLVIVVAITFVTRNAIMIYFKYDFLGDCLQYWIT